MRIIRFLPVFLAVIFIFGFSYQAQAYQDFCPQHDTNTYMKRKINKTRVFKGTTNDFTEHLKGHSRSEERGWIGGFVTYKHPLLETDFEFKYEHVNLGPNKYCVRMTHVRVYFVQNPQVFLPTDYKKTSCEYKQILKHEKRHLKALKDFHKEYAPRFEAHLGRVARGLPVPNPVPYQNVGLVIEQLEEHYVTEFADFIIKATEILDKRQQKIDSPQEYRGVFKRCDNW
tara:strand:- start:878 stop:1561 length:684 start_codon:yes stop_codon:yes gene_type:complete